MQYSIKWALKNIKLQLCFIYLLEKINIEIATFILDQLHNNIISNTELVATLEVPLMV